MNNNLKKFLFWAFLFIAVFTSPKLADAAIAFDATSTATTNAAGNPITVTHTVTGSDTILFQGIWANNSVDVVNSSYAGVLSTRLGSVAGSAGSRLWLYYQLNPATGANTASTSFSGTVSSARLHNASYTGAAQVVPEATSTSNTTGLTLTVSATSTSDNAWMFEVIENAQANVCSASTNTRIIIWNGPGSGSEDTCAADSGAALTPAGQRDFAVTRAAGSNFFGGLLAVFAPAAEVAAVVVQSQNPVVWWFDE